MHPKYHRNILAFAVPAAVAIGTMLLPEIAMASVESSLGAVQEKLISTILPLIAIIGLVIAALSFVTGNPNAKTHFFLALMGAGIGFGAPSLIALIRTLVH